MKRRINKLTNYSHFIPIVLFLGVAILSLFWIPPGMITYFHDENIPLNPAGSLFEYFYVWRDSINMGFATSGGIQKLLPFSIFYVFDLVGLGIRETELTLYFVMLFFAGFGSYLLFLQLAPFAELKLKRLAGIISGLFYIFSPFIIFYVWRPNYIITRGWFYAFVPFLLYGVIKFCMSRHQNKSVVMPSFLITITGLLITPSFSHPSFPIILLLLMVFIFIILLTVMRIDFRRLFTSFLLIGVMIASINTFWLVPRLFTASSELDGAASVGLRSSFEVNSEPLSLDKNFMLSLTPPLFENTEWYAWQDYYLSPYFLTVTALLAAVMLSVLFKPNRYIIITAIAFLLFWPLMLGLSGPLGNLSSYVFDNVAIMQSFRDPGKWGFLLIYFLCSLLGIGFVMLLYRFSRLKIPIYMFLVLSLSSLGWPIITGHALPDENEFPSSKVAIPDDYATAADLIREEGRPIIQLPFHGVHNYAEWQNGSGYKGIDIMRMKTSQPLISYYQSPQFNELLKTIEFNSRTGRLTEEQLSLLMRNINSDQILVNKDSDNSYVRSSVTADEYIAMLDSFEFLDKIHDSQNLVLYSVQPNVTNTKMLLTDNIKVNEDIVPSTKKILGTTPWHIAEHLGGNIKENNQSLSINRRSGDNKDNYFYIKNDTKLNIDTTQFQYIKIVSDADPKLVSIAVSADGAGEQSEWLESLAPPKVMEMDRGKYVSYYSTAAISEDIVALRINFISRVDNSDINVTVNNVEAIDGLFNDYGRLTTYDMKSVTYLDEVMDISKNNELGFNFKQINPTLYEAEVKIDGSAALSLMQTYDKNWRVEVVDGNDLDIGTHLLSNGFYNTWKLSGDTDGQYVKLKISYTPQKYFIISLTITIVSIVIISIVLIYKYIIERRSTTKL